MHMATAPEIQREQWFRGRAHGMRFETGVMYERPRLPLLPVPIALPPCRASRQGYVELLGLVLMGGVVRVRTQ